MEELHLRKKDFKIDWFSGTGNGGQNKNKTQNTCRITHIATGLRAMCGDYRERPKNQAAAFKMLADRILAHYQSQEVRPTVNTTVIRNYHQPDQRVKDAASGLTQSYDKVVLGNHIGDMIEARAKIMIKEQSQL